MIGALAGDIIGSYYEAFPTKEIDFPLFHEDRRFTDDTVLTVAVADWILNGGDLIDHFHAYFDAYRQAGFGMSFFRWAGYKHREPYNSWGNGSAMRVSPVGFAFDSLDTVLLKARKAPKSLTTTKKEFAVHKQRQLRSFWLGTAAANPKSRTTSRHTLITI